MGRQWFPLPYWEQLLETADKFILIPLLKHKSNLLFNGGDQFSAFLSQRMKNIAQAVGHPWNIKLFGGYKNQNVYFFI